MKIHKYMIYVYYIYIYHVLMYFHNIYVYIIYMSIMKCSQLNIICKCIAYIYMYFFQLSPNIVLNTVLFCNYL
jgi:hypothetical protein